MAYGRCLSQCLFIRDVYGCVKRVYLVVYPRDRILIPEIFDKEPIVNQTSRRIIVPRIF